MTVQLTLTFSEDYLWSIGADWVDEVKLTGSEVNTILNRNNKVLPNRNFKKSCIFLKLLYVNLRVVG
jgi:hypothetical protein